MRPLIGITQCLDERGRWRKGREYAYLDHAYVRSLDDAAADSIQLPIQRGANSLVDRLDALLLPGGDDFLPESPYPESVSFEPTPTRQIEFDRRVLERALERGIPILGICYGAQLLSLLHGGSLHYHLPLDLPGCAPHQLSQGSGRHSIALEADSRLADILGVRAAEVNSLHHQAIADEGRGLRVSARSPDGVIEAIESPAARFVLGVQWHPEKLDSDESRSLFAALVAACAEG